MLPDFEFRPNGAETEPVYRFRRPTVAEKNFAFRRAVRAKGGVWHSEFELLAALEKGVTALTEDGPDRAAHLATIAGYRARLAAALERMRAEQKAQETVLPAKAPDETTEAEKTAQQAKADALVAEARETVAALEAVHEIAEAVRRGYPRYAAMEADRAAYLSIRGLVAVEMFGTHVSDPLTGEILPMSPGRIAAIPEAHIEEIGGWCQALMAPGDAQRKNSPSPSPASATAPNSTSSSPSAS